MAVRSAQSAYGARVREPHLADAFRSRQIVETAEDFGSQGSIPTHPELLDWLATGFVESGWDVKALHKRIVMSAAYRQSSDATDEPLARDARNELYARGPRWRMTAEMVRDNALAASGLLVAKVGGPSVMPYQPESIWNALNSFYQYPRAGRSAAGRSAPTHAVHIREAQTRCIRRCESSTSRTVRRVSRDAAARTHRCRRWISSTIRSTSRRIGPSRPKR